MESGTTLTLEISEFPCFLCGKGVDLRRDKNGKLYFICEPCGLQAFIRRRAGMNRIVALGKEMKRTGAPMQLGQGQFFSFQREVAEIEGLREEISRVDAKIGLFFPDENLVRIKKALVNRLENAIKEIEKLANESK